MPYIGIPLETDVDVLVDESVDYIIANIPGFVPREGHLEMWLIETILRHVAETRDVASRVPDEIFTYLGETLHGLAKVESAHATSETTWTAGNADGYTIPAGTLVAKRLSGNVLRGLQTTAEAIIPVGSTTVANVPVEAIEEGTADNELSGTLELVDALSFIESVVLEAPTSGGVDTETDESYRNRLVEELRLLTPRPILPMDFAVLARRIAGVHRATAIDNYEPAETVAVSRVNGSPTLTFLANVITVEDIGRTATGTGVPGGATIIARPTVTTATLSANASSTGDGNVVLGERSDRERMVTVAVVDEEGQNVSQLVKDEVNAYLESLREINFIVHVIDPARTVINVTFTIKVIAGFDFNAVQADAVAAVTDYLDPANWGGGDLDPPEWRNISVVRYLEIASVLDRVSGVDYVAGLTVNAGQVDVALAGAAPLPTVGVIDATVI